MAASFSPKLPAVTSGGVQLNFDALNARVAALENAGTEWLTFPGAAGWENYGRPFAFAEYRKGPDNRVSMRGLVKHLASTGSTPIGTLPEGFRPQYQQGFPCIGADASGTNIARRVDVTPAGVLQYEPVVAGAVAFLFLDSISFYAE